MFDIEVNKPWEYTKFPIRSVSIIYILYGLPLKILKMLGEFYPYLISAYWVLVVPRLITAILSLVLDFTLTKLCRCFDLNEKLGLRLLASSYIMLTYMTRTFTNSIEAVLFALLLLLLYSDPTIESYTKFKFVEVDEDENNPDDVRKATSAQEQLKFLRSSTITFKLNATLIGVIGAAGLYNRPTFAALAIFPALMYCEAKSKKIYSHALYVGVGALLSVLVFTVVDTLYFGENFSELLDKCNKNKSSVIVCYLTSALQWIVITPYNFLIYNMNPHSLAEHGIHPRYLHFIVNLFLLFGPVTILFYRKFLNLSLTIWRREHFCMSNFPAVMVFVPVLLLSIFPHQEPRFLIAVLPLIALISVEQLDELRKRKSIFIGVWIIFNLLLALVYGFVHQGGVTQSLLQVERHVNNQTAENNVHDRFVYYRTYMPPNSLLLSKAAKSQIVDAQGGDLDHFLRIVPERLGRDQSFKKNQEKSRIYVVTPTAVVKELKKKDIHYFNQTTYYGHLSIEDLPNFSSIYNTSRAAGSIIDQVYKFVKTLADEMTLQLLQIDYNQFHTKDRT